MLVEFRVENHRSLRNEQVLTMEAGRIGDEADARVRQFPGLSEELLPVAVLYGANASGKSNVLAALAFMREAVVESHRQWPPDEGVPRDPFAWGPKRNKPSLFEVTLHLRGVRYQYGFVASDERFLEEWLYAWPHGKKQVWLERDADQFKFGEHLKGENKLIESVTRPNALFLSAAVQHMHEQVQPVFNWFRRIETSNVNPRRRGWLMKTFWPLGLVGRLEESLGRFSSLLNDKWKADLLESIATLVKSADFGIFDLKLVAKDPVDKSQILLRHSKTSDAWLPLEEESRGTQTLFFLALPILQSRKEGGLLLVDELEKSLHPMLALQIVRQFNDPATNPRNAQLICTTHDTNLLGTSLGEPALRRDQVWLTEKDPEGATELYPLTNYKPRKAENLERGYLQGRYGAIPFLGDFNLSGE